MSQVIRDLGAGSAADPVLFEVLTRVGRAALTTDAVAAWTLESLVKPLSYVPKNKPFLLSNPVLVPNAQALLDEWPDIGITARQLLVEFAPCKDPRFPDGSAYGGCYGCKTDDVADFGYIYSSTTDPMGCVEGLVSSLANWKLYALGLKHYEWTDEFITVAPDARFAHPLRPSEQVPAGTVIHTAYCFQHVLQWYRCLRAHHGAEGAIMYRTRVSRERIERALPLLTLISTEHVTAAGADLLGGMLEWAHALLEVSDA